MASIFSKVIIQVSVDPVVHAFHVGPDVFFEAINPLSDMLIGFLGGLLAVLNPLVQ